MVKSTRITSHSTSPHRRSARRRSTVSRRRVRCEAMMRRRVETKCLAATTVQNNNNKHRNRCYFTIIWYVLYKHRMCILIEHILKIIHLQIFHIYIYICALFFSYYIMCIIYYNIICALCFSFLTYLPWGKRSHVENPWGNHRNIIYIHGG